MHCLFYLMLLLSCDFKLLPFPLFSAPIIAVTSGKDLCACVSACLPSTKPSDNCRQSNFECTMTSSAWLLGAHYLKKERKKNEDTEIAFSENFAGTVTLGCLL